MFEIIAVTNRHLCYGGEKNFLNQIEKIAAAGVHAVILREKDLPLKEYEALAREVAAICDRYNIRPVHGQNECGQSVCGQNTCEKKVRFIPHIFTEESACAENTKKSGCKYLHFTWAAFKSSTAYYALRTNHYIGVSVHSPAEACYASERGAAYLIAGHVFETGCKEGLKGRGLRFLSDVCKSVSIPVYGIGGISEKNIAEVAETGAAGACLMSAFMQSPEPAAVMA
jgi:thiamine-phosphate pyrophosphorylase